jgi:hypothetical protein
MCISCDGASASVCVSKREIKSTVTGTRKKQENGKKKGVL